MLKIAYNQNYIYPLEENHRFPMIKYELIPEQLIRENTCSSENFFSPNKIDDKIVLNTHQREYFERFTSLKLSKKEIREIGFPLSQQLVERELQIADGTIKGVKYSSVDLNGNEYIITASTGEIDFKNTDIIFLQDVKALISVAMELDSNIDDIVNPDLIKELTTF